MKLNVKKRKHKVDRSWMHCCRYCHYYKNGKCLHERTTTYESGHYNWFETLSEDGDVQSAISEAMLSPKVYASFFDDIVRAATSCGMRTSAKALKQFKDNLMDCYDIFVSDSLPYIDGSLCNAMRNKDVDDGECSASICDPDKMCCTFWE